MPCMWHGQAATHPERKPMTDTPTNTYAARYAAYRATRIAVEPTEPRCRICRDPDVRRLVNDLLDWHGKHVFLGGGKTRRITYAEILGMVEPLNEGCDERDRITYNSLWVHAKRHYDVDGVAAYWARRITKELRNALGCRRSTPPTE